MDIAYTTWVAEAPGRVNLIGDHTDYNGLPVFPMAIERRARMVFHARADERVRLASEDGYGEREFAIGAEIEPYAAGDWGNYVKASAQALARRYGSLRGMEARVHSNIPAAAGLSSSSALVVASALAILKVNGIEASFEELMEVLPEGERYVGTRGGGMDHAVSLAGRKGMALKIDFDPFAVHPTPVPEDWCFVVGHSLVRAEKSAAVKDAYNYRRENCRTDAKLWRHVVTEAERVERARIAMCEGDMAGFGALMNASHASLKDDFEVSHPEVDKLVECFRRAGACGARVTGAGFGGCVVALCGAWEKEMVMRAVEEAFYAAWPERSAFGEYLMEVRASDGARVSAYE